MNCDRIARVLPEFKPQWTVRKGVEEVFEAYKRVGLTTEEFLSSRYLRIKHIREMQAQGRIDQSLRWTGAGKPAGVRVTR